MAWLLSFYWHVDQACNSLSDLVHHLGEGERPGAQVLEALKRAYGGGLVQRPGAFVQTAGRRWALWALTPKASADLQSTSLPAPGDLCKTPVYHPQKKRYLLRHVP